MGICFGYDGIFLGSKLEIVVICEFGCVVIFC